MKKNIFFTIIFCSLIFILCLLTDYYFYKIEMKSFEIQKSSLNIFINIKDKMLKDHNGNYQECRLKRSEYSNKQEILTSTAYNSVNVLDMKTEFRNYSTSVLFNNNDDYVFCIDKNKEYKDIYISLFDSISSYLFFNNNILECNLNNNINIVDNYYLNINKNKAVICVK